MIVVATEDFELYHDLVNELRDRGAAFTTRTPEEAAESLPEGAEVVLAGPDDGLDVDAEVVRATEGATRAVEAALASLRGGAGRTVVGVDPGDRPGVAVLSGELVVAVYHVPLAAVGDVVGEALEGAADPVVRVGDGARLQGARIVDDLPDVRVELVDETGTTPSLGTGARGMGDVVAAINIARLEGDPIEERDVTPTAGELQTIKDRSRRRSDGDRTIGDALARRVAVGELTLEEAIERHREG